MEVWNIVIYLSVAVAYAAGENLGNDSSVTTNTTKPGENYALVVRIKSQGLVRGRKAEDGAYYQYTGIPYATASQENRFKSPLPVPSWEGIREANVDIPCSQFNGHLGRVVGQEDCLVVNVYTPERNTSLGNLPVMVFIHGGGYNQGSAEKNIYGPRRFMEENVILVTFNYRLSILGFLCSGDTANDGLKDAVAVLEWVQSNTAAFGGDPRKVTLFGQSAGAAMVDILMLSKRTKGLFAGAIAQSGLVSSPWAFGSDPEEKVSRVAKQLGYEGNDREERMRVLKNASVDDLIRITESLALMTPFELLPVSPCVEPPSNVGAIITIDPSKIIESGDYNDVPYMQGFTKDEAMLLYGTSKQFPTFIDMVNADFLHTLPKDLRSVPQADRVVDLVRNFYFGDKNVSEERMSEAVMYFTDVTYVLGSVHQSRRLITSNRKAPMYMYEFAYDGGLAFLKFLLDITSVPGVCHADDLGYLFTLTGLTSDRDDDILTARRMVKLWTNFAKFQDPTPETSELLPAKWAPVTEDLEYLLIDRNIEMRKVPFPPRIHFWDSIYKEFAPKTSAH